MEIKHMNSLTLAYVGDAIYEVYIRQYLTTVKKIVKVKELQKEAVKYVSARGQAKILKEWIDNNLLTEEEMEVMMRARNH
ncbi:MAG: ribonuclease III, partial [Firmicutes bacterium]|nr:ribonuclease III [Bacillota bacterium]